MRLPSDERRRCPRCRVSKVPPVNLVTADKGLPLSVSFFFLNFNLPYTAKGLDSAGENTEATDDWSGQTAGTMAEAGGDEWEVGMSLE